MHTKSMLLLLQLCYFCLCVTLILKEGDTSAIKCITLSFYIKGHPLLSSA